MSTGEGWREPIGDGGDMIGGEGRLWFSEGEDCGDSHGGGVRVGTVEIECRGGVEGKGEGGGE